MLDLAGLPLRTLERDDRHPLVVAGGAQAFSPEPMAEFIDAFVIGDGEDVIHAVVEHVKQAKRERLSRARLLRDLAHVRGVYVPSGYVLSDTPEGRLVPLARPGFPERVHSVWVKESFESFAPPGTATRWICGVSPNRVSIRISRFTGCQSISEAVRAAA